MNRTKQILIKISGILSILEAVGLIIATIVTAFGFGYIGVINDGLNQIDPGNGAWEPAVNLTAGVLVFIVIIEVIFATLALVGGILLLKSVSDPNMFKNKKGLYTGGAICTIIASGAIGLSAILLYISFALRDEPEVYAQPNTIDVQPGQSQKSNMSDEQIKSQMDVLREMKERGEISNEEFKEMMFELIKKS